MGKHAYLIMAHRMDDTLITLLKMIDYEKNDIYLHMDKKLKNFEYSLLDKYITKSEFIPIIKRRNITWGGYSQINMELVLLKEAISKRKYEYYHFLSGQDLPIKSQKDIHSFFEKNAGKEFVQFQKEPEKFLNRVDRYYLFQDYIGRDNKRILIRLQYVFLKVQEIMRLKRNKNIEFRKGDQWFSITHSFANYIVSKEYWIKKVFNFGWCADELLLQTLLYNSKFRNNLFGMEKGIITDSQNRTNKRLIDWGRGGPYTYTMEDLEEILNSEALFARKFDCEVDKAIIEYLYKRCG